LFQRFQFLVWPDQPEQWRLVDREPNRAALLQAEQVYERLASISPDEPVRLRFCSDAQVLFFAWLTELEHKIRDPRLPPPLAAHLAKYRSLMPSLAGLFSLTEFAASGGIPSGELTISPEQAQKSAAICGYLEAHARRAYACIASPKLYAARELARHIQAGELSSNFTIRDVYRKNWSALDGPDRVRSALTLLEDAGWVRRIELKTGSRRGRRPSESWEVNPQVVHHAE
jgi:Protein of unknown function (DUF3987)